MPSSCRICFGLILCTTLVYGRVRSIAEKSHLHDIDNPNKKSMSNTLQASLPCKRGSFIVSGSVQAPYADCASGYDLRITRWHARVGNVLHQLANALFVAVTTRSVLHVPHTGMINRTVWDFRDLDSRQPWCSNVVVTGGVPAFWGSATCPLLEYFKPAARRSIMNMYLLPHLTIPALRSSLDELVIYIRSGDIFGGTGSSPWYVQPPLAFYETILERRHWRRVTIITDYESPMQLNPVVPVLLHKYPYIMSKQQSLEQDVATLIQARHVVGARSTLFDALAFMGQPKTCAYLPECDAGGSEISSSGVCFSFLGYTKQGTWTNSKQQRSAMLSFPKQNVRWSAWGHDTC